MKRRRRQRRVRPRQKGGMFYNGRLIVNKGINPVLGIIIYKEVPVHKKAVFWRKVKTCTYLLIGLINKKKNLDPIIDKREGNGEED